MSDFNFKSQICTNREQSERLLTLGLKKETADMCITDNTECTFPCPEDDRFIPAWSLSRLIDMCYVTICIFEEEVSLSSSKDFNTEETLYSNLINGIEWLIKEGYFNKEYLV